MEFPWPGQQMLWCSATIYELVQMRTDFGFGFYGIVDPLDKAKNSVHSVTVQIMLLCVNCSFTLTALWIFIHIHACQL